MRLPSKIDSELRELGLQEATPEAIVRQERDALHAAGLISAIQKIDVAWLAQNVRSPRAHFACNCCGQILDDMLLVP